MRRRAENTAPRRKTDWRRIGGRAALLGSIALSARIAYLRNQPERLPVQIPIEVPGGIKIYHGIGYWRTGAGSGALTTDPSTIHAVSLTTGRQWEVVREPSTTVFGRAELMFTQTDLLYAVMPRPTRVAFPRWTGGNGSTGNAFTGERQLIEEGDFRASLSAPMPGEKRQRQPEFPWTGKENLRRVPLAGGIAEEGPKVAGRVEGLAGDAVYWLNPRPDEVVIVTRGSHRHSETTGHSDLMRTPLQGGKTQLVLAGLPMYSWQYTIGGGIWWTERPVYPNRNGSLYYCPAGEVTPHLIASDLPHSLSGVLGGSLFEYAGRVYWFTPDADAVDSPGEQASYMGVLNSANTDGSDRRMVLSLRGRWHSFSVLGEVGGQLYCLLTEPKKPTAPTSEAVAYPTYLCRLRPERTDPMEIVRTVPGTWQEFQLDEGYLYFRTIEKHRSWLDWALNDEAHVETKSTFCRIRLPH